jgi:uncharacterized damage-inducible protein DinB
VGAGPETESGVARGRALEVERELIEAFRKSGLVNEHLVKVLPRALWRLAPPAGRGRPIAAIVAHMQSVRRTFARMGGARPGPPSLDRDTSTPKQAREALRQSTEDLAALFETALTTRQARVKGMPRRTIDMLTYLMQHDAHHRGQICWLARDLGHQFQPDDTMRIWGWKALPPTPARRTRRGAGVRGALTPPRTRAQHPSVASTPKRRR